MVADTEMAPDMKNSMREISGLEYYRSSFIAERLYLQYNPELIAIGKIDPKKDELRMTAITLVDRIISTMATDPSHANSPEHEGFKERLFTARRNLYRNGEMGYLDAQKWGFDEQVRRNNKGKKKSI